MYKIKETIYPCPTSLTMKYIGGKWKAVILIHLKHQTRRYNELKKEIPTITERTLSLQLKQLEEDGLIDRKVFTDKPPLKVEYKLTDFGKTLIPLLEAICTWGQQAAEKNNDIIEFA